LIIENAVDLPMRAGIYRLRETKAEDKAVGIHSRSYSRCFNGAEPAIMPDQAVLDFDDEYGLPENNLATSNSNTTPCETGDSRAETKAEEEGGATEGGGDGDASGMRLVCKRRGDPSGARRTNYARLGAASLAARIQFVASPSGRVVPGQGADVRVTDTRDVKRRCGAALTTVTAKTFGVFTDASETAVRWAKEIDIRHDERPVREVAFLWALQEQHERNWVKARRLFAAAAERRWSKHCLRKWSAKKLRAFPHEIEFPSGSYDSFDEYGERYGAFYFGGDWRKAQPRESRSQMWGWG
jgi:hypothetical protein